MEVWTDPVPVVGDWSVAKEGRLAVRVMASLAPAVAFRVTFAVLPSATLTLPMGAKVTVPPVVPPVTWMWVALLPESAFDAVNTTSYSPAWVEPGVHERV